MAAAGSARTVHTSADFKRLQDIEQKVIACVETAAEVVDHLAKPASDHQRAHDLANEFMNSIKSAQELILQAVGAPIGERTFEANAYPIMIRANLATEKVKVVSSLLKDMQQVLASHNADAGPPRWGEGSVGDRGAPAAAGRSGTPAAATPAAAPADGGPLTSGAHLQQQEGAGAGAGSGAGHPGDAMDVS